MRIILKPAKRTRKLLIWCVAIIAAYFFLDAVYFGYGSFDQRTGVSSFYWSGLDNVIKQSKVQGFLINKQYPTFLDGVDGPYVFDSIAFTVNDKDELVERYIDSTRRIKVLTGIQELPWFMVTLRESYPIQRDHFETPAKLIAISDIEGNFLGLYGFLLANQVIDSKGNWTFGNGSLVFNGDFMDRGSQVVPLLWFIYHLENQAAGVGGKVHFILGNHEMMNIYGNASDNDFKYVEIAKRISGKSNWSDALRHLYSEKSELGKWLRSKNVVERIGDLLFVHGGLNKFHVEHQYSIAELNAISRKYIGFPVDERKKLNERDRLIVDNSISSPYWDRRLNYNWKVRLSYLMNGVWTGATTQRQLEEILQYYGARMIIIGHSNIKDICFVYNKKAILLNVSHAEQFQSGKTKGLLVQKGEFHKIDDQGNRWRLGI